MTLFSVIIPVFNRANLISQTLGSVLAQKTDDYEVIVVDDGSTDGTIEVLNQYSEVVTILRQTNKGPGAARNLGIMHARGQYIAFLDSDDLWFPWTLSIFKSAIEEFDTPAFIAGTEHHFRDEAELNKIQATPPIFEFFEDYYTTAHRSFWIGTCAVAIKADFLYQAGAFSNRSFNAEDSDLWLKLGVAPGFVYIHSPTIFGYRQHSNSAVSNQEKTYRGICYLIQQEKTGAYPGNKPRYKERRILVTSHVRSTSFGCLKQGHFKQGWRLYQETLLWHLQLGRLKYIIGFPIAVGLSWLRKQFSLDTDIYRRVKR